MLAHAFFVALRSLKRSPGLTLVLVAGLGVGIGVAVTFAAVRHAFSKHPVPQKEGTLRYVRLDSWDPRKAYPARTGPALPTQVTYRDMAALMRSKIPVRQSGSFRASLFVHPDPAVGKAAKESVRLVFSDFFAMFEVPFRYGGPWDRQADEAAEPVVVLGEEMNEKLFGGRDSVGRTVRIEDRDFRVTGVLAAWRPNIRVYDLTQSFVDPPEPLFVPFSHFTAMKLRTSGNSDGWGPSPPGGFEGILVSEQTWIQLWVELPPGEEPLRAYRAFVEGYIGEQKKLGRFARPMAYRLSTVRELVEDWRIVPEEVSALYLVGLLFLAVSAVNLIGLLLGKFLARSHEVGVRRALGATRLDVFLQHVVECELVALLGGAAGVLVALAALAGIRAFMMQGAFRSDIYRLDLPMLAFSVGLALAAWLVAGTYPSWRASRLSPAIGLKE